MIAYFARSQRTLAGFWSLLIYALVHLRVLRIRPVTTVFERQIYFTGIEALKLVAMLGLLLGTTFAITATSMLGVNELSMRTMVLVQVGELGPMAAAIIVIARSGVAMAAELALMQTRDETAYLCLMRIPPLDYLVVPRVAAATLSLFALTVYFQTVAVAGGLATSALFQNATFVEQLGRFFSAVTMPDIFVAAGKSVLFGLAIATVSCFHGLDVGRSATAIPIATVRAVVQGLIAVFLIDGAVAYARYGLL